MSASKHKAGSGAVPSLLKQQLMILGHVNGPIDPVTRREKERLTGIVLPSLHLPGAETLPVARRRLWRPAFGFGFGFGALMMIFAALALFVYRVELPWSGIDADDKLRVKGENKIWVYWERQGVVRQLDSGISLVPLRNGDRVRAEVLAAEDLIGYLAVRGENGVLLGDREHVQRSALKLKAGEKGTFAGSVKLVGEDEGEKLLIVLCGATVPLDLGTVFVGERQAIDLATLPGGCHAQEFPLR